MFCILAEVPIANSESDSNSCEMNKITSAMFPPIQYRFYNILYSIIEIITVIIIYFRCFVFNMNVINIFAS